MASEVVLVGWGHSHCGLKASRTLTFCDFAALCCPESYPVEVAHEYVAMAFGKSAQEGARTCFGHPEYRRARAGPLVAFLLALRVKEDEVTRRDGAPAVRTAYADISTPSASATQTTGRSL